MSGLKVVGVLMVLIAAIMVSYLFLHVATRDLLQNGTLCVRQVRVSLTLYTFIEGVLCIVGYHFIFCVQRNS